MVKITEDFIKKNNHGKKKRILLIAIAIALLFAVSIIAYNVFSTTYNGRVKMEAGVSGSKITSVSFTQRFIMGLQSVGNYNSTTYSGRFGILDDTPGVMEITSCINLTSANTVYQLTNNIYSNHTCIIALAENVTLNCNNYMINYSRLGTGYGVLSKGYNHTSVQNCIITQGASTRTDSHGIFLNGLYNATLTNNRIILYGSTAANSRNFGIFLNNSGFNSVVKNNVTTYGRMAYGIYLVGVNSTNITDNIVHVNGSYTENIYLSGSSENTINSNNLSNVGAGNVVGIYLYSSSYNNASLNNISMFNTGSGGVWMVGTSTYSNNISLNDIYANGTSALAIRIMTSANSNEINSNKIFLASRSTIGIGLEAINQTIIDGNDIIVDGQSAVAIRFYTSSHYNNITNNNINATALNARGLYLTSSNFNFIANNSVVSSSYPFALATCANNTAYNNIFNTTTNTLVSINNNPAYPAFLNTSKTSGNNIIGGNYIGGNFWVNGVGTGYSQTCNDINGDGLCDGAYNITSYAKDYYPLTATDAILPGISILTPLNNSFVNGRVEIIANATDNSKISRVFFEYSNSTKDWTLLTSCNLSSANYGIYYRCYWQTSGFNNNTEGYKIRATAIDSQGNSANDAFWYFIDRSKPIIFSSDVIYPDLQSSVRDGQNIILDTLVTDSPYIGAGIDTVEVDLTSLNSTNWANLTFFSGSKASDKISTWRLNVTISAITGLKLVTEHVVDAALPTHNTRNGNWLVQVDNDAPTYNGLNGENNIYNNSLAGFAVNAQDNFALKKYIFASNWSGIWVNSSEVSISGTSYNILYEQKVNTGNFSYQFLIFDDAGNMVATTLSDIQVLGDMPTPSIYLLSPEDKFLTKNSTSYFDFYYTGTDSIVDNCSLMLDGIINDTIASPALDTFLTFNPQTLPEGVHEWYVSCTRLEEQGVETIPVDYTSLDVYSLIVDKTNPIITLISPENITYAVSKLGFNITTDEDATWCAYDLNNQGNSTLDKVDSTTFNIVYNALTPSIGVYNISFSCNDSAGNNNATGLIYFSVKFPLISANLTSPLNNSEMIRGSKSVSGEDDIGYVASDINFTGRVYNETFDGVDGATCRFFINNTLMGESYTNASGDCILNYSKSSLLPEIYNITLNYTYLVEDISKVDNQSDINIGIVQVSIPNAVTNLTSGKYKHGDVAKLLFNVTKTNVTGTYFYDPLNVTVNATSSSNVPYQDDEYPTGYRVYKTAIGQYQSWVVANKTFNSYIKWDIFISDNHYLDYIGTAIHADTEITDCTASSACAASTCIGSTCTDDCGNVYAGTKSCGGECFISGTKIKMADGTEKNIEDIKIGEMIKTYNLDKKIVEAKPVLQLSNPIHNNMIVLKFENTENKNTFDHPYYVKGKGWVSYMPELTKERYGLNAGLLEKGDVVYRLDESDKLVEDRLISIREEISPVQTYNLHIILDNHNYFANGILVHNKGPITCTDKCSSGTTSSTCISSTAVSTVSCITGSDGCLEWGSPLISNCAKGYECSNGECVIAKCQPSWECGDWTECINASQTRNCIDLNSCGENTKTEERSCRSVQYENCYPYWNCTDWGECQVRYSIGDVLENINVKAGSKERVCTDLTNCAADIIEFEECNQTIPIDAKKTQWCGEEYVEIYDRSQEKLVSRVKESEIEKYKTKRIDISLITTQFTGYCDYCFDGLKDYDEDNVDCGGANCPPCIERYNYFDWVLILTSSLLALFIILLISEGIRVMKTKRTKEITKVVEHKLKHIYPTREEEKAREEKIKRMFIRLISSIKSFKLPRLHISISKYRRAVRHVKKPELREVIKIEKVEKKVIAPEERLLNKMKRKLAEWKKSRYYGTAKLEREIFEKEAHLKKKKETIIHRIIKKYKIRKERKALEREHKRKQKEHKKIREEAEAKERKARKESMRRIKYQKKEIARKHKEERRKIIHHEKAKRKERKKKIKAIKKEIRNRKIKSLIAKIKLWKKEGYYGTAELEKELTRLKSRSE